MKIKSIAAICKKNKNIAIFERYSDDGDILTQYIGDGFRRLIIRKEKDMATPYKECPHCGAHLDSGEKCECRAEEIETVHSQKCACGLTEQDVESGWECPLDNPNETVECCEDCAFAKETD